MSKRNCILLIAVLCTTTTLAQNSSGNKTSPEQIVRQMVNLEMGRASLSAAGREKVSDLFLGHEPFAENPEIVVISSNGLEGPRE